MNTRQALVLMCRYPFGSPVKTRLAQALGSERTAQLYAAFIRDVLAWAAAAAQFELLISLAEGQHRAAFSADFDVPSDKIIVQQGQDLGQRLAHSLELVFQRGYQHAALMASDTPELNMEMVLTAFAALANADLAVIPTTDGGYSLLALQAALDVFSDIAWSTERVLAQTLALARAGGWRVAQLPTVADIDELEDLRRLYQQLEHSAALRDRLPQTAAACRQIPAALLEDKPYISS